MIPLRIKICGITSETDARQAALLGADAIGLNFYAKSPRCVDFAVAPLILRSLPPLVEPVGVFANERIRNACEILHKVGMIRVLQWHGENRELCDPFPFRLISAFPVREQKDLLAITRYLDTCAGLGQLPAAILVDGQAAGQYGGTGQQAPWKLLAGFKSAVPMILAGGLHANNVAEAIRIVRPFGVDTASGVESSPGVKDIEKMRRFIGNAREAVAGVG